MNKNNDNTPPRVPPILVELNNLAEQVFLKKKPQDPHNNLGAAEKKLSDGRNPLTLKDQARREFLESILVDPSSYSNEQVGEFMLELEKLKGNA